jgi:hypothetical protein
VFTVGELGVGYSSGGLRVQTTTATFAESLDLTRLASRQDLVLGLFDGYARGAAGVTRVVFRLEADGQTVVSKVFTSAAAAVAYFTNDAIDLGSLASGQALGADTLTLSATLTVTSDKAGSGFYGDIILGEPAPAHQSLPAAMAAFGAGRSTATTAYARAPDARAADNAQMLMIHMP